jgi:predicted acyltransferase
MSRPDPPGFIERFWPSDCLVIVVHHRQDFGMPAILSPAAERPTTIPETSHIESTPTQRIMSVDALRGIDMFFIVGMEEVFEALSEMFPMSPSLNDRLQHAPWAGFHFYDLIFPLFAFIIGVSLVFSLSKSVANAGKRGASGKILKRSLILFLLGILYYEGISGGVHHIRLLGVLQRLALCYCGAGLAFVWLSQPDRPYRKLVALTALLLVGYWAMLTFIPVPGFGAGDYAEGHNLTNWVDKMYLPLRRWDGDHDPEGLLSTVPAIASSLLGVFAGLLLKNRTIEPARKVRLLVVWGCVGVVGALLWNFQFPIIKKIWSSSFVLFTAGISSLLLALFYYVIDIKNHRDWCRPFVWIGMNAITIYLIAHFVNLGHIANCFVGGEIRSGLENVHHGLGALVTALLALCFSFLICRFLYQRKIFLRV